MKQRQASRKTSPSRDWLVRPVAVISGGAATFLFLVGYLFLAMQEYPGRMWDVIGTLATWDSGLMVLALAGSVSVTIEIALRAEHDP